jgi:hypothetical protein
VLRVVISSTSSGYLHSQHSAYSARLQLVAEPATGMRQGLPAKASTCYNFFKGLGHVLVTNRVPALSPRAPCASLCPLHSEPILFLPVGHEEAHHALGFLPGQRPVSCSLKQAEIQMGIWQTGRGSKPHRYGTVTQGAT